MEEKSRIDFGPYGSVSQEEAKSFAVNTGRLAMSEATNKLQQLKLYAEQGQWTWRIAGFLAGLLIVGSSVFSFIAHFFSLSPFSALLDVYLILFGFLACILEYKDLLLTAKVLEVIKREALFLYRPYGRAAFYFFVGLLLIANGGLLGFLVGSYSRGGHILRIMSCSQIFK